MHNPLRSEADAFRWLVVIAAGVVSATVLTLLTRPVVGVVWTALLNGIGVGFGYRSARGSLPRNVEVTRGGDGKFRLLVIANETVQGEELLKEIRDRCRERRCEVMVVTPALASSRTSHWTSDIDEAIELARQRMELSLIEIKRLGLKAKGEIGDSDPNVAIEDALRVFAADEILISTHPADRSRWLERGVVDKAREQIDLPITHVVVDLATGRAGAVTDLPRFRHT
jgi:GABA permease